MAKSIRNKFLDAIGNNIINLKCYYCKCWLDQHTMTLDHIVSKYSGGKDSIENFAPCCYDCNNRKGSKKAKDFVKLKNKNQLPTLNKIGQKISYSFPSFEDKHIVKIKSIQKESRFGNKLPFFKTTNSSCVYYNHDGEDKNAIKLICRKEILKQNNLSCKYCKCFLDEQTLCFSFIGTKAESPTRYSTYFVFNCYECSLVSDKNFIKEKVLPTRTNSGKPIKW